MISVTNYFHWLNKWHAELVLASTNTNVSNFRIRREKKQAENPELVQRTTAPTPETLPMGAH